MSLGPDARAFLDLARDGDDPSQDDARRVRAKVAAQVAIAGGAGALAGVAAKTASAGTKLGFGIFSGKTALGVAVATTIASGAVVYASHESSNEPDYVTTTTAPTMIAPKAPPRPGFAPKAAASTAGEEAKTQDTEPESEPAPVVEEPAAVASIVIAAPPPVVVRPAVTAPPTTREVAPVTRPVAVAPPPIVPPPPDQIAEEAALIRAAQAALASGDASTANTKLSEHAARFPRGALAEDREAAQVHALCKQGRVLDARTAATTFVASHPNSPHVAAIRKVCTTR